MLNVLVYPVDGAPYTKEIPSTLVAMQELVGGSIEVVNLGLMVGRTDLEDYALVCDEEGKIKGLPPRAHLGHDIIMGQFFIAKSDEYGEFVSMDATDVKKVTDFLK